MRLSLVLVLAAAATGGELDVLRPSGPNPRTMVAEYLARQAKRYEEIRDAEVAAIRTVEQLQGWQRKTRARLIELLGGLPQPSPLNARILGKLERDGYRVERIVYESQPRLYVTANLYLPTWKPAGTASPAFIGPVGHWPEGKTFEDYQRLGMEMARHGYILFVYDPIGQGERLEYFDPVVGQDRPGGSGTTSHTLIAHQCFLIGDTLTKHFIWDGVRAIDYLLTRPEVDRERIGSIGGSGGGTLTRFITAVDERVKLSIPVVSAASKGGVGGASDGEQNVPGHVLGRIWSRDHWWLVPPRPLLNLNASEDRSYGTALASLEELKQAYRLFDREADAVVLEAQGRHGIIDEMRRSAFEFIDRHWANATPVRPAAVGDGKLEKPQDLWVTETGQVWTSLGGTTVFDINRQRAGAWILNHSRMKIQPEGVRQFLDLPATVLPLKVEPAGSVQREGRTIEKVIIESEPGILVPGLVFRPKESGRRPAVLYLDDRGKAEEAHPGGRLDELADRGFVVLAVDVRGTGETAPEDPARSPQRTHDRMYRDFFFNPPANLARGAMNLGRPLLSMRVQDALAALSYLASRPDVDPADVRIFGHREGGVIGIFAAALDARVRQTVAHRSLVDFRTLLENRYYAQPASLFVLGILRHFDLPQVAAAAGPRRVLLINAVDAQGRRLAAPTVRVRYLSAPNIEAVINDYPDHLVELAVSSERL
jgi:cephalosporin-C deacetylase-like acetyl esterase